MFIFLSLFTFCFDFVLDAIFLNNFEGKGKRISNFESILLIVYLDDFDIFEMLFRQVSDVFIIIFFFSSDIEILLMYSAFINS